MADRDELLLIFRYEMKPFNGQIVLSVADPDDEEAKAVRSKYHCFPAFADDPDSYLTIAVED